VPHVIIRLEIWLRTRIRHCQLTRLLIFLEWPGSLPQHCHKTLLGKTKIPLICTQISICQWIATIFITKLESTRNCWLNKDHLLNCIEETEKENLQTQKDQNFQRKIFPVKKPQKSQNTHIKNCKKGKEGMTKSHLEDHTTFSTQNRAPTIKITQKTKTPDDKNSLIHWKASEKKYQQCIRTSSRHQLWPKKH